MQIHNKASAVLYKALLGILASVSAWVSFQTLGLSAWRLFSTSILIIAALYYLISALILAIDRKREARDIPCPMLEGALIVSFVLTSVTVVALRAANVALPGLDGWSAALVYFILPALVLFDWSFLVKKGLWRPVDPFYWLAFPTIYVAAILFSAEFLPATTNLRYPLPFLDYANGDFANLLSWLALIAVLILIFSYILVILDFILSGELAKHIVLPKIKTVVVSESTNNAPQTDSVSQDAPSPEVITAKPIQTKPHSANNSKSAAPQPQPKAPKSARNTDGIKRSPKHDPKNQPESKKPTPKPNPKITPKAKETVS